MKQSKGNTDKLKALRREALKATDETAWQNLISDMTDPNIGGLSQEDAIVVGKALRQAYIKEALGEDLEDEESDGDEVDAEVDEERDEEPEEGEVDEEMPFEEADNNVEDEVEFSADAEGEEGATDGVEFEEDIDLGPAAGGIEEMGDEFGDGMEEEVLSVEEPMTIVLPGGIKLRLEVEDSESDDLLGSDQEEELTMKPESLIAGTVAARHAKRMAMLKQAAEQQFPEDIPATNRGHGDDTSHGGRAFEMEDGRKTGVDNPGEKKPTMTLDNSEGNVLRSDPGWNKPVVPTKNRSNLQNEGAKDSFTFENEKGGWSTRTVDSTESPLPAQGLNSDDKTWEGEPWDKGFEEFDPPTQLPQYTSTTKTTILASPKLQKIIREAGMMKECSGCNNPGMLEIEAVQCPTCEVRYALCEDCITDIEDDSKPDECPICTAIAKEAGLGQRTATGPNWSAWAGTPQDEKEAVKDDRGDDVNGDGGFRTTKMKGGMPKDKDAEDMDINADQFEKRSMKSDELTRENQMLKREIGRIKMAAATAATMAEIGDIEVSEIVPQMGYFIESDLPTTALKTLRETFAQQAQRRSRRVISDVERNMTKTSRDRGVLMSPYPNSSSQSLEMVDLQDALKNIFVDRKFEDYED